MEKIFIVAGTWNEYRWFKNQLVKTMVEDGIDVNRQDIVYLSPDSVRGHRDIWGYKVGSWESRMDLKDLVTSITLAGSSITEDFIEVELVNE